MLHDNNGSIVATPHHVVSYRIVFVLCTICQQDSLIMSENKELLQEVLSQLADLKTSGEDSRKSIEARLQSLEDSCAAEASLNTGPRQDFESLASRVKTLEENTGSRRPFQFHLDGNSSNAQRSGLDDHTYASSTGQRLTSASPSSFRGGFAEITSDALQAEFRSIQDSYSRTKLPGDLRLNDSRTGIKQPQREAAQILAKSAKFVETQLKILASAEGSGLTEDQFMELFLSNVAHIRFLQERYAGLVVGGSFGKRTQDVFMSIQNNSSVFTPSIVESVKSAITLTNTQGENQSGCQGSGVCGRPYDRRGNRFGAFGRGSTQSGGNSGGRRFPPADREEDS